MSLALYHAGEMRWAVLVFIVGLGLWPTLPVLLLALHVVFVLSGPDCVDRVTYGAGVTIIAATALAVLAATIAAWRAGHRHHADWLKSAAVLGWFIQGWFWSYAISSMLMYGID